MDNHWGNGAKGCPPRRLATVRAGYSGDAGGDCITDVITLRAWLGTTVMAITERRFACTLKRPDRMSAVGGKADIGTCGAGRAFHGPACLQ